MLNYEKRLVVVTYCIHFEVLVQLDAEAPIFVQVKEPVAHTSVIVAPVALPGETLLSEYDIFYVHS